MHTQRLSGLWVCNITWYTFVVRMHVALSINLVIFIDARRWQCGDAVTWPINHKFNVLWNGITNSTHFYALCASKTDSNEIWLFILWMCCVLCVCVCVLAAVCLPDLRFFFCLLLCRLLLSLVLAPRFGRPQKNREPAHRRRIKASVRLMDQLFSIFDYDFSNDTHSHLLKQISISKI